MLNDYRAVLKDLDKANVLESNNVDTLRLRANVKGILEDHRGALEDLDKADVLEPNNANTLQFRGNVKKMLDDRQGALEDLDKADILKTEHFAISCKCQMEIGGLSRSFGGPRQG
jgi:tetratricopeptide (TPR) repeat protein